MTPHSVQDYLASTIPEKGASSVVSHRSLPPLQSGQVCIKITATAINPIDWKLRDWGILLDTYPAILGSDASGIVHSTAPDVTNLASGDRVFFQGIPGTYDSSTFQQYCIMPQELLAHTPSGVSDEQAAGVWLTTIAALTAIYDETGYGLRPLLWEEGGDQAGKGKGVVAIGGSSSVGQYAIQLARLAGFERIITNSSHAHIDYLKTLGATTVLDRTDILTPEDFVQALEGVPLGLVFDTISIPSTHLQAVKISQAAEKVEKRLVVRINLDDAAPEAVEQSEREPKVHIKGTDGSGSARRLRYLSESAMKYFGGEEGVIAKARYQPNRVEVVSSGLGGVEEALKRSKEGVSGVKLVIKPFETVV